MQHATQRCWWKDPCHQHSSTCKMSQTLLSDPPCMPKPPPTSCESDQSVLSSWQRNGHRRLFCSLHTTRWAFFLSDSHLDTSQRRDFQRLVEESEGHFTLSVLFVYSGLHVHVLIFSIHRVEFSRDLALQLSAYAICLAIRRDCHAGFWYCGPGEFLAPGGRQGAFQIASFLKEKGSIPDICAGVSVFRNFVPGMWLQRFRAKVEVPNEGRIWKFSGVEIVDPWYQCSRDWRSRNDE